ncbi:uncharacterized protein LOC144135181 isoform X2 [Amblyomma americanum]
MKVAKAIGVRYLKIGMESLTVTLMLFFATFIASQAAPRANDSFLQPAEDTALRNIEGDNSNEARDPDEVCRQNVDGSSYCNLNNFLCPGGDGICCNGSCFCQTLPNPCDVINRISAEKDDDEKGKSRLLVMGSCIAECRKECKSSWMCEDAADKGECRRHCLNGCHDACSDYRRSLPM